MQPLESKDNLRISERKPKVLVIDDEPLVLKAMEIALANEGYDLYFADDGKKGLEVFHKEAPQLIFLDLKMPRMNGYEFLKAVQPGADSPFTIVVITGHGENRDIERCYEMGIDFFLRKPLSLIEICGLAKRCIHLKELEKERLSMLSSLWASKDELELRVSERTDELTRTVASLESEIKEHNVTTKKLENKTRRLTESNIALEVLLKRRDEEKANYEIELNGKIDKLIRPYIEKLKDYKLNPSQKNIIDLLEQNLNAIVSPYLYNQLSLMIKLTAKEIQVSNLIKQGMSNKEIAAILDISTRTVETHRYKIRKKIGLEGKNISLRKKLLETY